MTSPTALKKIKKQTRQIDAHCYRREFESRYIRVFFTTRRLELSGYSESRTQLCPNPVGMQPVQMTMQGGGPTIRPEPIIVPRKGTLNLPKKINRISPHSRRGSERVHTLAYSATQSIEKCYVGIGRSHHEIHDSPVLWYLRDVTGTTDEERKG